MAYTEDKLAADLKNGHTKPLYFLYGKEVFLTKTYTERITEKNVGKEPLPFNSIRLDGNPDPDILSEHIDSLPFFVDKKVIVMSNFEPEKCDNDQLNRYLDVLSHIPETTVVIISITAAEPDIKKAKTKKIIALADKIGCSCSFDYLTVAKTAELIIRRVTRFGAGISRQNAEYIAELTLCNLTLIIGELEKLCAFTGKGNEITRKSIDDLVARQLDANIYMLATAITSGKGKNSFNILDDLISQRIEPIIILSALSGAFTDFYRAKVGKNAGVNQNKIAEDFNYPKNRAWAVGKAMTAVSHVDIKYIRNCLDILSKTDLMLKSSHGDKYIDMNRVILEETIVKLVNANA